LMHRAKPDRQGEPFGVFLRGLKEDKDVLQAFTLPSTFLMETSADPRQVRRIRLHPAAQLLR
jgi:hypothetical protein